MSNKTPPTEAKRLLGQIIDALPIKRDWLDPELEKMARRTLAAPDQGDGSREGDMVMVEELLRESQEQENMGLDSNAEWFRALAYRLERLSIAALPSARKDAPEQAVAWMDWNEDGVAFVSGSQKPKTRAGENWQPLYAHTPRLDAQTVEKCAVTAWNWLMDYNRKNRLPVAEDQRFPLVDAIRALRST